MSIFGQETSDQISSLREKYEGEKIGFTCSCFDLLHPGHVVMLEDAKSQCDVLVIGLQTDPTIDRPTKNKPIQTFEERKIMIKANRFVDEVIDYATEADLVEILMELCPDVRILGSDYEGKNFTGKELGIPIYYHRRDHNWSSTDFRRRIYLAELDKRLGSY